MSGKMPEGFEEKLAQAMRRVEAPEGFAALVMARAEADARTAAVAERRQTSFFGWASGWLGRPALGGAMAALVLGLVFGGAEYRQRVHEREVAERNFAASQQITEQALEHTREQLQRAGVALDQ